MDEFSRFLSKELMSKLSVLGSMAKREELEEARTGILFRRPRQRVICGCAFPDTSGGGCNVSGGVMQGDMSKVVARIYKKGYIPVGMMIISPYGGGLVTADRRGSFSFLREGLEGFVKGTLMMVIDNDNVAYFSIYQGERVPGVRYKLDKGNLKKVKGGVVWISQDNWTYSILKDMGEKVLQL